MATSLRRCAVSALRPINDFVVVLQMPAGVQRKAGDDKDGKK
jgi:hypothetical protein